MYRQTQQQLNTVVEELFATIKPQINQEEDKAEIINSLFDKNMSDATREALIEKIIDYTPEATEIKILENPNINAQFHNEVTVEELLEDLKKRAGNGEKIEHVIESLEHYNINDIVKNEVIECLFNQCAIFANQTNTVPVIVAPAPAPVVVSAQITADPAKQIGNLIAQYLLEKNIDPNTISLEQFEKIWDQCLSKISNEQIKEFIEYRYEDQSTILHLVASEDNRFVVKWLLEKGMRPYINLKNLAGQTAYDMSKLETKQILIDYGANGFNTSMLTVPSAAEDKLIKELFDSYKKAIDTGVSPYSILSSIEEYSNMSQDIKEELTGKIIAYSEQKLTLTTATPAITTTTTVAPATIKDELITMAKERLEQNCPKFVVVDYILNFGHNNTDATDAAIEYISNYTQNENYTTLGNEINYFNN